MGDQPIAVMDAGGLLDIAVALATQAASLIMRIRAGGFVVEHKSDASPVTQADYASEALIVGGLLDVTPDIPIVAEETVAARAMPVPGPTYWLVDPLDGTREFAQGTPDFTVNIALIHNGAAVLGVVALPAHDEIFAGLAGKGAWKQGAAGRQPIRVRTVPAAGLTVMASRHYADDPELAALLAPQRVAEVHNIGSAVKFCRLAEGVADFYPRLGRTMEWDTAAPQVVLEAAGGSVTLMEGGRLRYGKPYWINPPFIGRGASAPAAPER